jgi:hypothetical protein
MLQVVRREALAPSSLLVGVADRRLASNLRALEDKVLLFVALEAKSIFLMSLTVLIGQSATDSIEVNTASV